MSPFKRVLALLSVVALFAGTLLTASAPANAAGGVVISNISPNFGPTAGGTFITITGSGFTGTTDVVIGAAPASFTEDSDTQITAIAPASGFGGGFADVMVVGANGMYNFSGGFEYIAPSATAPDAPTNLAAIAGDTQISLTWDAPASDGGSPITSYLIYIAAGPSIGYSSSFTTSSTITGLTNGTAYTVKVLARNAVGDSGWSNGVIVTPAAAPVAPGAATGLTVNSVGNGTVNLSWTAPASDGGAAIDYYYVVADDGVNPALVITSTSTTVTFPGLTNGTTYTFKVRAHNSVGYGPDSTTVTGTPSATTPDAPQSLGIVPGNTELALTWTAPASDGGSPITGYFISWSDGVHTPGNATVSASTTAYTITGLTNGTDYTVEVRAQNAQGNGPSAAGNGTPTAPPATAPTAPLNVTATAGNGQITVTWDAPDSDGGSPITQYGINYDDFQPAIMVTAPASSYTITGLTNGTTYTIGVYAVNTVGNSTLSDTVTATPTAPSSGGSSTTQNPTPQVVTVTWNGNGAKCDFASSTAPVGTTVNAPTCAAPTGFHFIGWDRPVPFTATSDVTVTANVIKTPGWLVITDLKVNARSIKFVYSYVSYGSEDTIGDETPPPADTFIIVNDKGELVCSSQQGTETANTCTGVGARPGNYVAYAQAHGVDGPRFDFTVTDTRPILITCKRTMVAGKMNGITCNGETEGFAPGDTVIPMVRFSGQLSHQESPSRPRIGVDGKFTWTIKSWKKVYVYFTSSTGSATSNKVRVPAAE